MENEIWKSIRGYEELYEVSNLGRIKSLAKKWQYGFKDETILKEGRGNLGYTHVVLSKDGFKITTNIHRIVAIHFCSNPDNHKYVNHINSIRSDNRAINLEWTTGSENVKHSFKYGFKKPMKGEENGNCRLTKEDVLKIRELYEKTKISQYMIADLFGVEQTQISRIVLRKRWKHIL